MSGIPQQHTISGTRNGLRVKRAQAMHKVKANEIGERAEPRDRFNQSSTGPKENESFSSWGLDPACQKAGPPRSTMPTTSIMMVSRCDSLEERFGSRLFSA